VHDLDTRLERLAADATRDAVVPEPEAIARRGRRRRRRQLAGSATLLVVAIVVAGMVLPARRADHRTGHPAAGPATDVSEAGMLTGHWFGKADASVFLAQHVDPARRQAIHDRIQALDVVDAVFFESRQEAYDRAKVLYRNRPELLANVGPQAMPESFRVRLDNPGHFKQLFLALCRPAEGGASGKQRCIRGVDLVSDIQAAVKPLLIGKGWLARSDLTVILPGGPPPPNARPSGPASRPSTASAGSSTRRPPRRSAGSRRSGASPATVSSRRWGRRRCTAASG